MPLKVNGVTIVNSTANVQTSTLPDVGITNGTTFGNTTHTTSTNVSSRGLINTITTNEIQATSIHFEAAANTAMSNQTIFVSTSTPTGGANGDIWYQTFS
tara:strand:+ start:19431 stop:19730 length:300 start_codon:yes stop_codon:yes gene_type:complete